MVILQGRGENPNSNLEIVIASISTPETEGNLSTRNLSSEWVGDMLSGGSFLGAKRSNLKPVQKDCHNPSGSRNDSKDAPLASLCRDLGEKKDYSKNGSSSLSLRTCLPAGRQSEAISQFYPEIATHPSGVRNDMFLFTFSF